MAQLAKKGRPAFRIVTTLGAPDTPPDWSRTVLAEQCITRPRVSNDNPYSEALFRTCKYRPVYPPEGFTDLQAAQDWVAAFVRWYNDEHRHSVIRYVTPAERHDSCDHKILAHRKAMSMAIYEQARQNRPERWSGDTRNWRPVGPVTLNPQNVDESLSTEPLEVVMVE